MGDGLFIHQGGNYEPVNDISIIDIPLLAALVGPPPWGLQIHYNQSKTNANNKSIHKYPQTPSILPVAALWYPADDVKYPVEGDHILKWKIGSGRRNCFITKCCDY
jgi:hypothetical protein